MPRPLLRRLAIAAAVAAVYYVGGKLGLRLAFVNASATAVWPPTGIALASFLILGNRVWPGVLAGAFLVNLTTAGTVATSIGIAIGNTLEGLLGAYLVRRFASGVHAFQQPRDIFRFAGLAGMISTALSATVGVVTLALAGFAPWPALGRTWITWWLGDAAGALVLAPLLILWSVGLRGSWNRAKTVEAGLVLITVLIVSVAVFAGVAPRFQHYPLQFLCVPPLLWAAFRFTQREASTALVAVSVVAIWGTLRRAGPFGGYEPTESLVLLQAFMAVTSVTILAAAAAVSERRRIESWVRQLNQTLEQRVIDGHGQLRVVNEELRGQIQRRVHAAEALEQSEARLREAQTVARIGSWEWDVPRNRVWWSDALFKIYGLDSSAFGASYEAYLERVHPDDRDRVHACVQAALDDGHAFSFEHRIVRPDGEVLNMHARGRVVADAHGRPIRMMGTGQDITERRQIEDERANLIREQAARREAEEANRSKDDFLATLSHELRNPLNAIVGWARLLRDGQLDPAARARAVDAINRNADLQSQLILDLLDVSRITAGRLDLRRQPVDLPAVVEAAIETVRPTAHARGIALHCCLGDDRIDVVGDPDRLQQVVANLLSNAVRFAPERGRVRVSLGVLDSQARIAVEDDGPGIDPELLPHVFDRFRRGNPLPARRQGGLGLGLTIVKRLVELHGGSVHAANVEHGHGAIFRVALPLAPVSAGRAEGTREPHARSANLPTSEPLSLRGLRILVVEDDPDSREALERTLADHGAETLVAASSAEALARFDQCVPDVLISDIGLPDASGYELLTRVRELPGGRGSTVAAIALTAYAGAEHAGEARRRGYQAHVAKPFEVRELVRIIEDLAHSPSEA